MTIGVALSTFNRNRLLQRGLVAWTKFMPPDAPLVIVDDGSRYPIAEATHRHPTNQGIASTKNTGIAALMDYGVDHLFLVDDDCWPVCHDWWKPYVDDPLPHLMLCWGRSRRVRLTGNYSVWHWPRGVMLYTERRVIDTVGGMRPEFNHAGGGEHVEWSRRIHNNGFTPWPFVDLLHARNWWHAEDWGRPHESNRALGVRRARASVRERGSDQKRHDLYERYRGSKDFVPYVADGQVASIAGHDRGRP